MSTSTAVTSTAKPTRSIQSVRRAAAILRALSGHRRRLGVVELARELGLSKATAYGILRTLELEGLVEQDCDSGKYQLGAAVLPMGFRYLQTSAARTAALNGSYALAIRSGESARVGILYDKQVLILHQVFGPNSSHQWFDIGSLVPVHATALGKALLTQHLDLLPEIAAETLQRYTPATVVDIARLQRELDDISKRGWAADIGELSPGVGSIAAPIAAHGHTKPGAIGIEGSVERLCKDGSPRAELVSAVLESARAVSRELGSAPWSR